MKLQHSILARCLAAGVAMTPIASQAALLGLTANLPTINFGGGGIIDYDNDTGTVTISGDPAAVFSTSPFISGEILGTGTDDVKDITIKFVVDSSGNFVSGVGGSTDPDLMITGSIDTDGNGSPDYNGTLLTAEVTQFGWLNGASGEGDSFDLRLNAIGGSLAYLYTGQDLAVTVISEVSTEYTSPFSGNFSDNWKGQAKGVVGSAEPISSGGCHLHLKAQCSVAGGPFKDKCRIKKTRSPKHWERCEYSHSGHQFKHSKYGMHGDPIPNWAANYPSTPVTFKYTVKNKGANPVSDLLIEDSFDTPVTGYPTTLDPEATFSVTRTENLHEDFENVVKVVGSGGGEMCGDHDIVVIKDKLRDRKKYDDDDFRDKGNN